MTPADVTRYGPERAGMLAAFESCANGTDAVIRLGGGQDHRLDLTDQREQYTAGVTDEPDPLAPARGLATVLACTAAFWLGVAWTATGVGDYLT